MRAGRLEEAVARTRGGYVLWYMIVYIGAYKDLNMARTVCGYLVCQQVLFGLDVRIYSFNI